MKLFLTLESQIGAENLSAIMRETEKKLDFVIDNDNNLESLSNYGTEFRVIAIIPTCISKEWLEDIGWKERRYISRKNKEADIRLFIDYERFINETPENQRLLYIKNIIDSINVVIEKSKGDFRGEELKRDILKALDVSQEQLDNL